MGTNSIRDQSITRPASPPRPDTLASWHPRLFSCQSVGSPPNSSRPSILITFQQTGQFVGPNPLHHKRHNGAYSGLLSSLDLTLPSGQPHFLLGQTDSSRHACENQRVCLCRPRRHAHGNMNTHPRAFWGFIGAHCCERRVCEGEDFSCHTSCSLGDFDGTNPEGGRLVNVGSLGASLISKVWQPNYSLIRMQTRTWLGKTSNALGKKPPKKTGQWLQNVLKEPDLWCC